MEKGEKGGVVTEVPGVSRGVAHGESRVDGDVPAQRERVERPLTLLVSLYDDSLSDSDSVSSLSVSSPASVASCLYMLPCARGSFSGSMSNCWRGSTKGLEEAVEVKEPELQLIPVPTEVSVGSGRCGSA